MIIAKKRLGQNFLTSKNIVSLIVETALITQKDTVLEVGPGKGILTEELLRKAGKVIAIEKDIELVDLLKDRFKSEIASGRLELLLGDALKFSPNNHKLIPNSYKIVANIPYYITSRFLRTFLEEKNQPEKIVLLIQKEVADRITTRDNKESILSISVKVYGNPKIIKKMPASFFKPKPKVDSAIILIDDISKKKFKDINEKTFFEILKKGFSSKRKLLKNNLKITDTKYFEVCGIPTNARAENVGVENWLCLSKNSALAGFQEK